MTIPNSTNPAWFKLISGEYKPDIEYLATKILLSRLSMDYKLNPSSETAKKSVNELINLFQANIKVPKVQNDLKSIFGKEISL